MNPFDAHEMPIEYTVAAAMARLVRERVPGWTEEMEPGLWAFTDPDEDYSRMVLIDGRRRFFKLAGFAPEAHFGPLILGVSDGMHIEITMPYCTGNDQRDAVLDALTAIGALPAPTSGEGEA